MAASGRVAGAGRAAWERWYAAAEAYAAAHGDLDVPRRHEAEGGERLGQWLGAQRAARKRGKLSAERERRLEAIGMVWDVRAWRAARCAEEAARYLELHGREVPARYVSASGRAVGRAARYARARQAVRGQ